MMKPTIEPMTGPLTLAGIAIGALALLLASVHLLAGPFAPAPKPTAKRFAKSLKRLAVAALKGKSVTPRKKQWNIDSLLQYSTAGMGILACLLGLFGFVRREPKRAASLAFSLGAIAAVLHLTFYAFIIALIVIVLVGTVGGA